MYGKLVNNTLVKAPKKIKHNGRWYFNANDNIMKSEGWFPVIFTDPPEVPEGYTLQESFVITNDKIVQSWSFVKIPVDPEN